MLQLIKLFMMNVDVNKKEFSLNADCGLTGYWLEKKSFKDIANLEAAR